MLVSEAPFPRSRNVVCSGAWPHIKLLCTVLCLVLPPRVLRGGARDVLLSSTFVLLRTSHIETFVLVIMMVRCAS
jgi:hypothetical protein